MAGGLTIGRKHVVKLRGLKHGYQRACSESRNVRGTSPQAKSADRSAGLTLVRLRPRQPPSDHCQSRARRWHRYRSRLAPLVATDPEQPWR